MKQLLLRVVMAVLVGVAFLAQAENLISNIFNENMSRLLETMQFAPSFKNGIRGEIAKQKRSNAFLESLLAAPDEQITSAVIPILKKHFTEKEAKVLWDFYSSDTGRAITRQQFADIANPNPPVKLTAKQNADYNNFIQSSGGQTAIRLAKLLQSQEFWREANVVVTEKFKIRYQ